MNPWSKFVLAGLLVVMATQVLRAGDSYLYISQANDKTIGIWKIDAESGGLSPVDQYSVDAAVGSQCVHPHQPILYAALRDKGLLASFTIDVETGELRLINTVDAEGSSAYVRTDREGRYLFSAYYREGKVGVHQLSDDGAIVDPAMQWIETDEKAHAVIIDASNRYLFVPHTGPNVVYQFLFSSKTGKLKLNQPATVAGAEGAGPRHLFFNPRLGDFAYGSDELGSAASTYRLNPDDGTLNRLETVSTLPDGFQEKNTCADCEVHPSGKFVYVSNRGHNSIACFKIDQATGRLTRIQIASTEEIPRSFNIHPNGKYLFAAGQRSNTLATYRVDEASGLLTPIATQAVGQNPSWVQVVEIDFDK